MKALFASHRWLAGLALAGLSVALVSPAAHAGHGSRRYKGAAYCPPPARHVHHTPRVVYYERHSDAAPLVALIGGLVIGAAIAQATSPAPAYAAAPPPSHYYWDPWCGERFGSLSVYHSHFRYHHHPRVVRVISVESGDCLDTFRWHEGGWRSDHGGHWDH